MKTPFLLGLLAVGLLGSVPVAQAPPNPFALAGEAAGNGQAGPRNYLLPLVRLHQQRASYAGQAASPDQQGQYYQALATYAALADEPDSAATYWQRQPGSGTNESSTVAPALGPAIPAVLAQTRQRQLVLFNEEHTQPRGRWLLGSLLPALYSQGFRYLALEALDAADSAGVRQRGYPLANSGFYTNEPHFGNLIRRARQLGFRVVGYDAFTVDRERDQARNLLAATLAHDPQARVVVLAGHGHISEAGAGPAKHMAQYLRELSGLDPLTIDQTQAGTFGPAAWRQLPAGAYLVPAAATNPRAWGITADLYLLNRLPLAETGNSFGSPAGRAATIAIPADSLLPGQPQMLLVYWQHELLAYPNAEPVAVRYLRPGETRVQLALLPGTYTSVVRAASGQRRWQSTLVLDE